MQTFRSPIRRHIDGTPATPNCRAIYAIYAIYLPPMMATDTGVLLVSHCCLSQSRLAEHCPSWFVRTSKESTLLRIGIEYDQWPKPVPKVAILCHAVLVQEALKSSSDQWHRQGN